MRIASLRLVATLIVFAIGPVGVASLTSLSANRAFGQEVEEAQGDDPFGGEPAAEAPVEAPDGEKSAKSEEKKDEVESVKQPRLPLTPGTMRITLADGSIVTGTLSIPQIEVDTTFGKLVVPFEKLRSFTPGLGSRVELKKKIDELIDKLGWKNFAEREAAQKELSAMGRSVEPILRRYADDKDMERQKRIRYLLDQIEEAANDEETTSAAMIERDTIVTDEFTIVGNIVTKDFVIQSKYGPLNVTLADIRGARQEGLEPEREELKLSVDASHLVQRGLKKTVHVNRGDKITVTAQGQIMMTPWGNNAMSNPDGAQNFGWYIPNQIPGGALVASIGNQRDVFKVGKSSTFTAERTGVLQFGIAMMNDQAGNQFPGKYDVKVTIDHK